MSLSSSPSIVERRGGRPDRDTCHHEKGEEDLSPSATTSSSSVRPDAALCQRARCVILGLTLLPSSGRGMAVMSKHKWVIYI